MFYSLKIGASLAIDRSTIPAFDHPAQCPIKHRFIVLAHNDQVAHAEIHAEIFLHQNEAASRRL